ncbi:hypothetical protein ACDN41_12360 [Priestia aryabhattai]|uniref:hypothetical protein n=1 Tax=Priestia aryabhattai TaxID=412384 RepID=UPI00353189B5
MAVIELTVKQIQNLGLWSKVCEYKGWDEYIVNEGRISDDELVKFDDEFKKDEELILTRRDLIKLCEKSIVEEYKWHMGDSSGYQMNIGKLWALLKANCEFHIVDIDEKFINIKVTFSALIGCITEQFKLPKDEYLDQLNGDDWQS